MVCSVVAVAFLDVRSALLLGCGAEITYLLTVMQSLRNKDSMHWPAFNKSSCVKNQSALCQLVFRIEVKFTAL